MIIGAIFNTIALASLTVILSGISRNERGLAEKMEKFCTIMREFRIPINTRKKIANLLITDEYNSYNFSEVKQFVNSLPPSLRKRVFNFIFARVIKSNTLFIKGLKIDPSLFRDDGMQESRPTLDGIESLFRRRSRNNNGEALVISTINLITSKLEPVLAEPDEIILMNG